MNVGAAVLPENLLQFPFPAVAPVGARWQQTWWKGRYRGQDAYNVHERAINRIVHLQLGGSVDKITAEGGSESGNRWAS